MKLRTQDSLYYNLIKSGYKETLLFKIGKILFYKCSFEDSGKILLTGICISYLKSTP